MTPEPKQPSYFLPATLKFKVGDPVTMTPYAKKDGLYLRKRCSECGAPRRVAGKGIVTGFSRDRREVLVRLDGRRQSLRYAPIYWQKELRDDTRTKTT